MKWTNKGHQFDTLGKNFEKRNRIFIYGAGNNALPCLEKLQFLDCVDGFIDQSSEKQKQGLCGLPVYAPDKLFLEHEEHHLILISIINADIVKQLERELQLAGYVKNFDYFHYLDFFPTEEASVTCFKDNFYYRLYCTYAKNKLWLDSAAIFPSTVCNLHCKNCLAFTPHIKQHRIKSLEECKQEVDTFFQWIDFVRWFQISGGEPLLWPHLCELIDYIGKNYRHKIGSRFECVTNGTNIPSEHLLSLLKKYKMDVVIDDYGNNYGTLTNHSLLIKDLVRKNNIPYIYDTANYWFDLGFFDTNNADKNLTDYFNKCAIPFNAYENGKIYLCAYADFAIRAGLLEEDENEIFDLNTEITPERKRELLEFTYGYSSKGYSKLCERCLGWGETINNTKIPAAIQAERK